MASSWQRPPDTGCDADGIPHGFRKVMGDMAAEMGDDELMRASQGSIHDPRHTSKTFSDIHPTHDAPLPRFSEPLRSERHVPRLLRGSRTHGAQAPAPRVAAPPPRHSRSRSCV